LKNAKSADWDLAETEVNTLGYQLLHADKGVSDAIAIFELNPTELEFAYFRFTPG
jgi:hypothetical protein